ncbi:MAG: hypothetical protein AAGH99_10015 [Planctomycetota bacterium]
MDMTSARHEKNIFIDVIKLGLIAVLFFVPATAYSDIFDKMDRLEEKVADAKSHLENASYTRASKIYLGLWRNRYNNRELMVDMHSANMVSDLSALVENHDKSRDFFVSQRELLERKGGPPTRIDPLNDWIVVNQILGDSERTLSWYDQQLDDPDLLAELRNVRTVLSRQLIAADRWSDLWPMYPDPLGEITQFGERLNPKRQNLPRGMSGPSRDIIERMVEQRKEMAALTFDWHIPRQYAVVVASGRPELAEQVWNHVLSYRRVPELQVAMLEQAVESGFADQTHLAKMKKIKAGTPGLYPLQVKLESQLSAVETDTAGQDDEISAASTSEEAEVGDVPASSSIFGD